jgi:hypothetical protein
MGSLRVTVVKGLAAAGPFLLGGQNSALGRQANYEATRNLSMSS